MKKQLPVYKADILSVFPDQKVKIHYHQSDFVEKMTFDYHLEDGVTKIYFEFAYVKANNFLTLHYDFIKTPKKKTSKKESFSLSNLTKESNLAGISAADIEKIISIQKFHLQENKIIGDTPLEDQMKVYVSTIKNNLDSLIAAAKFFSELN